MSQYNSEVDNRGRFLRCQNIQKQDKSSDIEQQPPSGDRKISNIQPQNRGGGFKTNRNII